MPTFMIVLRDRPEDFRDLSPDEIQAVIGKYIAWSQKMEAQGRLVGGQKLEDEGGRVMRRVEGRLVIKDGPFAELEEVVSGIYLLRAKDYSEAVELCRDHPHLESSGPVELRKVDTFGASDD